MAKRTPNPHTPRDSKRTPEAREKSRNRRALREFNKRNARKY